MTAHLPLPPNTAFRYVSEFYKSVQTIIEELGDKGHVSFVIPFSLKTIIPENKSKTIHNISPSSVSCIYCATDNIAYLSQEDATAIQDAAQNGIEVIHEDRTKSVYDDIMKQNFIISRLDLTGISNLKLYYPVSVHTAVSTIQLCYNGTSDPETFIRSFEKSLLNTVNLDSMVYAFYLSCLSFSMSTPAGFWIADVENSESYSSPADLFNKEARKDFKKLVSSAVPVSTHLYFFSLYYAYCACRAVPSKTKFNDWVKRRYNAMCSSIQHQLDDNITFKIEDSGIILNKLANSRPEIKKVVYRAMCLVGCKNPAGVPTAIASQIKMLCEYAGMTTLNFINQVIAKGTVLITIEAIRKQIVKYKEEKDTIIKELKKDHNNPDEALKYYKLINPSSQAFKSTDYPDVIIAAIALDKFKYKKKSTMKSYKANTSGALVTVELIENFLSNCRTITTLELVNDALVNTASTELNIKNFKEILSDAQRALRRMDARRGIDADDYFSEEEDQQQTKE
ncbi:MAG: hypothetical protein GuXV1_gp1 [Guiyang xinmovirus 1]|nr:MAG: hypothetical protein GuXV1_gp1 [Guiyang xinmovirus 1]